MAISVPSDAGAAANLPPHNLEAEVSVLGAILINERVFDRVVIDAKLRADDFYRDRHRVIYQAMLRLKEKASPEPIDVLTVCEELTRSGALEEAGGTSYVHSLPTLVPATANAPHYAKIVKDHALMRRLLDASIEIRERVLSFSGNPQELVDQAEAALFKVAHQDRTGDLRTIEDVLHDELDKLEKVSREGVEMTGTPTGFRELDALTGGFQGGNLIVLAARPSMGKCLAGSAQVFDPVSGVRRRIDEVVAAGERGEAVWVTSVAADLKLRPARVSAFIRSGVQPVFRVTTRLGRRVDATANHPLLTIRGWKRVDQLEPGARIAVPRVPARSPRPAPAAAARDRRDHPHAAPRSWRELSVATGRPANHNWHVGRRTLSRHLVQEIAEWADDPELDRLAHSDIWWDEIASIEPLGEQETYDLTVPDHHNFVADDIVVHNSALVTNIAENASVSYGRPVALFSLEMSETELAQRFIASQAKLDGDDLRKGRVKPDRWPKVIKATQKLASAPLYVDDSSDIGIHELRAKARRVHARSPLGLIVVDYLQLMRPEDSSVSRVEQIGQMSRGLKILARELDVPVIAVSQLSRAVESRPDKKPLLSDLRESGNIEQDADVVIFIYRDEYYNKEHSEKPGVADLLVAKHRNGPVGDVELSFMPRYPRFANLYRDHGADDGAGGTGGSPVP